MEMFRLKQKIKKISSSKNFYNYIIRLDLKLNKKIIQLIFS